MRISFKCLACGCTGKAPEHFAGKIVACPDCGKGVQLPPEAPPALVGMTTPISVPAVASPPPVERNEVAEELRHVRYGIFMLTATANIALGCMLQWFSEKQDFGDNPAVGIGVIFVVIGLVQKAIGLSMWFDVQRRG